MTERDVIIKAENGVGHIMLNRPNALNALSLVMCRDMIDALLAWEVDPAINEIIINHSGARGFCAGGDIRQLYEGLLAGGQGVLEFFRTEYRLNHLLFTLRKPVTCIMDGVVMGGGAGIALPCRQRVATESTQFAMPETGIGLFPDVGGGWFLSRLPGRMGEWLALTGARLNGADCLALGLATSLVRSACNLLPRINNLRVPIDYLFAADRIEDIIAELKSDRTDFAKEQLLVIMKRSPTSCKVALRQLRESRKLSQFADNMKMEFRLVARLLARSDIREGIRAFIIDKDNNPRWSPQHFEDATNEDIDEIFAPLTEIEEWTPLQRD
jgi:enoyl-CoA hydratase